MLRRGLLPLVVLIALWQSAPVVLATSVSDADRAKALRTQGALRILGTFLDVYAIDNNGRFPERVEPDALRRDLGIRESSPAWSLLDEWGTPMRVEVTKDRFHYRLSSAGADRRFEPLAAFDGTKPAREELDDPNRDLILVDGELVHGLRPMQPPPEPDAWRVPPPSPGVRPQATVAPAAAEVAGACALLRPESVARLFPSNAAPRSSSGGPTVCRWSWRPPSAERAWLVILVDRSDRVADPAETIRTTYDVVGPPPPPRPAGAPRGSPVLERTVSPATQGQAGRWQDEEGIGDQARFVIGEGRRELLFRKGRRFFHLSLETAQSDEEDRRLARALALDVLTQLGGSPKGARPGSK